MSRPIVWSLAGSDCGGGAGLQADLLTIQDLGGHGCTLVTAITAQNSVSVTAVAPVSLSMLEAQRAALAEDLWPAAIKVGLLAEPAQLDWLADWLANLPVEQRPPVIYDPVLVASTGQVMGSLCHHRYLGSAVAAADPDHPPICRSWRPSPACRWTRRHRLRLPPRCCAPGAPPPCW